MPKHQFSHPSFIPPSQTEYVKVASSFIAEIAPTLPESVRGRVAMLTTAAIFSPEPVLLESIMEDPALSLCQQWCWPEANTALPFSLESSAYFGHGPDLWRGEQWEAKFDADRLINAAQTVTIDQWLYNVSMVQVRKWRDKLLPTRHKKGRKFCLMLDLKRHPEFSGEVEKAYHDWKQGLLTDAEALMVEARKPPVPTHLRWLVRKVICHLDNYHTKNNSWFGPEAFAARREQLIRAAKRGAPPLDERALQLELDEAFAFIANFGQSDIFSKVVQLAWGYLEQSRINLTPAAIARKLDSYAPSALICSSPCRYCASTAARNGQKPAQFELLCTCNDFIWVPKKFTGSAHEWKFGPKVDLDATIWALDRLLHVHEAELDRTALVVRVQKMPGDDDYELAVGRLLSLGTRVAL